jgi:hypothetical protein
VFGWCLLLTVMLLLITCGVLQQVVLYNSTLCFFMLLQVCVRLVPAADGDAGAWHEGVGHVQSGGDNCAHRPGRFHHHREFRLSSLSFLPMCHVICGELACLHGRLECPVGTTGLCQFRPGGKASLHTRLSALFTCLLFYQVLAADVAAMLALACHSFLLCLLCYVILE